MTISKVDAQVELFLLESKAKAMSDADFLAWLTHLGVAPEITARLRHLWEKTCRFGQKALRIGRIVVMKIIEFIKEHPNLTIGLALAAAATSLVTLVPFLGPLLQPLVGTLGTFIAVLGGTSMDHPELADKGLTGVAQQAITLAKDFFRLLASIFNEVAAELGSDA